MPRNEETPEQREARVKWLQLGCEQGLYHPTGDEVAEAMYARLHGFQRDAFVSEGGSGFDSAFGSEGELPLPERVDVEAPSITEERYARARDAQIRACYGLNVWERRILCVLLLLIGVLVVRNLPGIRDWEGWR